MAPNRDADWGPSFIKLSGYAPWGGRVYLNGHEWAKRQLARRGVGYVSLDNGFRSVDDPALLDALTASLGPDQIRAYFARWMAELPQPLTADDRDAGYGYALSMLQVEVSDTRVFDRPVRARQWFEATIGEQLTPGRPETVALPMGVRSARVRNPTCRCLGHLPGRSWPIRSVNLVPPPQAGMYQLVAAPKLARV